MLTYVPRFIPDIVQAAPFVLAFAILCARPLHRRPLAFYIPIAVIVTLVSLPDTCNVIMAGNTPAPLQSYGVALEGARKAVPLFDDAIDIITGACTGVWFYLIVMFIGVLHKGPVVKKLYSVRSELSVLGGIIVMGHVMRVLAFPFYFTSEQFRAVWGIPAVWFMFFAAVIVGVFLTIVFLIPWITSFKFIRRQMPAPTWRKVQKLAYPFMFLMLLQGLFLGVGHAAYGWPFDSQISMRLIASNPASYVIDLARYVGQAWIYFFFICVYSALLVRRRAERKREAQEGNTSTKVSCEAPEGKTDMMVNRGASESKTDTKVGREVTESNHDESASLKTAEDSKRDA